jgi:hypothetical protein
MVAHLFRSVKEKEERHMTTDNSKCRDFEKLVPTHEDAAEPVCILRAEYTTDEVNITLEEYLCWMHI